jgi:hypothetical protein
MVLPCADVGKAYIAQLGLMDLMTLVWKSASGTLFHQLAEIFA